MRVSSTSVAVAASGRGEGGIIARSANLVTAHPIIFVSVLALTVRVFIAIVLTRYFSGTLVLDDTTYHAMAQQMAEGNTSGWDDFTFQLYWSTAGFTVPITFLYRIFGASPIVGQLFVALMGTFTAVFVVRLALEFLAPRWAVVAGVVAALLPSQAFWSSMLMKDASVWFVLAGLGAIAAVAVRATGRHLALLGIAAGGLLIMLSYLRLHTLVVAAWALMIAAFFGIKQDRGARIAGALVLWITIPWVFGAIGPAGLSLVINHGSLPERRFLNAQQANTAIVPTDEVYPQVDDIPVRALEAKITELESEATALAAEAAELESQATELEASDPVAADELRAHAQNVRAQVEAAKIEARRLEAAKLEVATDPPVPDAFEAPLDPNVRHLPRGLSAMLLEPFPIPFSGSIALKLARIEALLWYPLLSLGAIGLWNVRRYLRQMAFPLLIGGGALLMYALSEGNVGTAHRHRGEFVWVVALLAAIGVRHLILRRRPTSTEDA